MVLIAIVVNEDEISSVADSLVNILVKYGNIIPQFEETTPSAIHYYYFHDEVYSQK